MNKTVMNKMNEYCRIMNDAMKDDILDLNKVLCKKDNNAFAHCQRVLVYCIQLGEELELSNEEIGTLAVAAFFHDIGKISIPDEILKKPEALTDKEMEIMKTHTRKGAVMLRAAGGSVEAVKALACHHERYDGEGYPYGLQGESIPLLSRIISVVDAYDVMTSGRCYSAAIEKEEALRRLEEGKGSQFDPKIVESFMDIVDDPHIYLLEAV